MGSLDPGSILGGGLDFKYFSGSMKIDLQFFSSLTSSHSFKNLYLHNELLQLKVGMRKGGIKGKQAVVPSSFRLKFEVN